MSIAAPAVAFLLALVVPSPDFTLMLPIILLGAWLSWIVWRHPLLLVSRTELTVRNSLHSVVIPLAAIDHVSGGRRLTIRTRDRRVYIPAAAAGSGTFLLGALRQTNTYGRYIVPLTRVDRARIDSENEVTPATVIARTICRRVEELSTAQLRTALNPDGSPRAVPPPSVNADVLLWTIVVGIGTAVLFVILM